MAGNDEMIKRASPHTIKKFELIEKYVESWAHKLLNNQYCNQLIFIDCMCSSGEYTDTSGKPVFGTPVRVARYLRDIAGQYPSKRIDLFFNDLSEEKIAHLQKLIPADKSNYHIHLSHIDGNELLRNLSHMLSTTSNTHYLLVYDPYQATIDWEAIMPFFNSWGEVIINHMLYDSTRAVKMAKRVDAIRKYEQTYQEEITRLMPYGSNRAAYEKRVNDIIRNMRQGGIRPYFIASFPFFNRSNSLMYDLIHCTGNKIGFNLYKTTAWQVFGGRSSSKNTHGTENQLMFDFDDEAALSTATDEQCYYIKDIAAYLQERFRGCIDVPFSKLWEVLELHPVFPAHGFSNEIKKALVDNHGAVVGRSTITFSDRK